MHAPSMKLSENESVYCCKLVKYRLFYSIHKLGFLIKSSSDSSSLAAVDKNPIVGLFRSIQPKRKSTLVGMSKKIVVIVVVVLYGTLVDGYRNGCKDDK